MKNNLKLISKKKFINVNIIYLYLCNRYIKNDAYLFRPFFFNIGNYFNYINSLDDVCDSYEKKSEENNEEYLKKLEILPLRFKFEKTKLLDSENAILYGYKFHFKGRFTRKQKAASVWFTRGALPVSSMNVKVEYSFFTVFLRYSACTVKIWLYKGKTAPTYKYKLN